ncbi:MAG TPA: alkaline phosphatase family protein [Labilithrix sp.]|nr:alkaline phosphatase family protein [Labilithrix sp.]
MALALAACGGEGAIAPAAQRTPRPSTTASEPRTGRTAPPAETRAPVVLAIVVDQLSAWVADERVPRLPADGFFARLSREGTWARVMRYPYATTDTAPGHAALHTGKVPSETHIVVNEIPDETSGARTSFFRDPGTKLVTPDGVRDVPGSSASALAVPTVADRLRAARPNARIVSLSLKDRAALLPAGKRPTHALWFDVDEGAFVTSTAIEPTFPAWARPFGDAAAITRARAETWEPLDAKWLADNAGKDDAPGEGDLDGLGVTFPHHARTARAFKATPMSDVRILELALAAAQHERNPSEPLLLLLSMSASDIIGHTFGPSSWEAWDHLRRLDGSLAGFLTALEAAVGPVRVVLSGDHGNSAMPEARLPLPASCKATAPPLDPYDRPLCTIGARLEPDELRTELRAAAARSLGRADLVAGVADGYVHLSPAGRALDASKRGVLDRAIRDVLAGRHRAAVAEVFDVRELATRCPGVLAAARGIPDRARAGEDVITLVCRSWTAGAGAGDYFVVPRHGSFFDGEVVPGKGTSHGTPWLYDRTVPLFVRGAPGEVDAGALILDPVDFSAYSAVEAAFLGLDPRTPRAVLDALRAR